MENIEVLRKFFKAFMKKDVEAMLECYHTEIVFTDPVFGRLEAKEARKMWRMLLQNKNSDLQISYKDLDANEVQGTAKWRAVYYFSRERRKVINEIASSFKFKDHKIIKHQDDFDVWTWAKQALGWKGWAFGWSADFQAKMQRKSRKMLETYVPIDNEKVIEN